MKTAETKRARIRVMLVDDHRGIRAALRGIIDAEPDLAVVADAQSGQAAIDLVERAKPDIVLMDGSMPGMSGVEATRQLRQLQPMLKVITLTLYEQNTYLEEMVSAGAVGYVLKTSSPENIIEAIRVVSAGGTYFDPAVPPQRARAAQRPEPPNPGDLTPNELNIARRVGKGQSNAEIANSLGLNISVVEKRRAAVMKKLGLRTRAELVGLAANRHWL
jgi:DNA-binding NarL/FixJ family response regulator